MSQHNRLPNLIEPFRVAWSGLIYTFKTQRHMRFHIYVVIVVLLLGIFMNLGIREIMVLLFTVSLVIVAEMFNSAIEAVVDLVQPSYHPLAKFAKDIAAGAVLITTIIALVVGGLLILGENRLEAIKINLTGEAPGVGIAPRIGLGLFIVFLTVVVGKGLGQRGQVLQGGQVSGHSAIGFFLATSIMLITDSLLVSAIAIMLAIIIAQSRWEARIHSVFELTLGAGVGVVVALVMFGLWPK
jgi:diacylglycerol kinase (ATP)